MPPVWFIDLSFGLFCAGAGIAGGALLRKLRTQEKRQRTLAKKREATHDAVAGLQTVVDSVKGCVAQHSECLTAIEGSLTGGAEDAAAASIIEANQLAQHQFSELQGDLSAQADQARQQQQPGALLLTTLLLDRQKHTYLRVLSSLEALAVEMAGALDGCGERLQGVSAKLDATGENSATEVRMAISNLLEATGDLRQNATGAEATLEACAQRVQMQAVLSHADLLTSLPNRRALEEQLERERTGDGRRAKPCSLVVVDLDNFRSVNASYGYHGGDAVLQQAALMIKRMTRGQDTAARISGDAFAVVLGGTTLSQALPVSERLRDEIFKCRFSEGRNRLRLTGSCGVAQLQQDERPAQALMRATMAVKEAASAGGNAGYYHDGQQCFPISQAHRPPPTLVEPETATDDDEDESHVTAPPLEEADVTLCGRSIFVANVKRRLAEWRRGGSMVTVVMLHVDQTPELVRRHDPSAMIFLRQVLGRLLAAATRDMDQRCDYDQGVFAVLLPSADEQSGLVVAQRLRSQVLNCKLRLGRDLWDLSASIGVADATAGDGVVEVLTAAAAGMERAARDGGDAVYTSTQLRALQQEAW